MRNKALQSIVFHLIALRCDPSAHDSGDARSRWHASLYCSGLQETFTMRRSLLLLPLCLVIALLAGCGNKGPLVLPTHPTATPTTAKPAAPALPATVDSPAAEQY
jgi:predicted small lipoprotein YifL